MPPKFPIFCCISNSGPGSNSAFSRSCAVGADSSARPGCNPAISRERSRTYPFPGDCLFRTQNNKRVTVSYSKPWRRNTDSGNHPVTRSFLPPHLIPMAPPALLCWYGQEEATQRVLLYQHKRASQRSVKVYPRCGGKKDLVTPVGFHE